MQYGRHRYGYGSPARSTLVVAQLRQLGLSSASVPENTTAGTLVGALTNTRAGSTFSLIDSAGSRFALSGTNINTGSVATNYESATSHAITVRETNAGYPNSPRDSIITINVGNVLELTLNALTLSSTALVVGTPSSGTINGATAGSSISASGLPAGFTVNGPARTWAWDGTGSVSTPSITLTETIADGVNSPRASVIALAITSAPSVAFTGATEEFNTLTTTTPTPQWQRGSGGEFYDIPGATASTFVLSYKDVGLDIRVRDGAAASTSGTVTEKPIVYDTFTEAGTGQVSIAGHVADVGGTWAQHPSGVSGVAIDRDTDRAVGTVTGGANFFMNDAALTVNRLRIKTRMQRTSQVAAMLVGFTNAGALDGYRFYNDGTWVWQRYTGGGVGVVASNGFGQPNSVEADVNVTFEVLPTRVRARWFGSAHNGEVSQADDTDAARKAITGGFMGLGPRTGNYFDNFTVLAVDNTPVVSEDAMWTWFTDPRAVSYGGKAYVGHINKLGTINVSKIDGGTTTQSAVGVANTPIDDHNNAALLVLPSGKLMVAYADHHDSVGTRYKISTNALPDISAFGTEQVIAPVAAFAVSYANLFLLSDNKVRCLRRGNSNHFAMCVAPVGDVEAGTPTWTITTVLGESQSYAKFAVSADNHRLYVLFGTNHPFNGDTAIYGCYLDVSTGSEVWKDLAGTTITAPVSSANATLIRDVPVTGGPNNWAWDVGVGADGHPRFLATRYPSGKDTLNVALNNIEYWHYRWTGSAIVQTQLASGQKSLYQYQPYYAGGMCFDGNDPTIIYMSTADADGWNQIGEYRLNEATQTLTKVRNITARTISHNSRPFSPKGHDSDTALYWWRGQYISYLSYDTVLHRAGAA
jgi:hypothetical protein